MEKNEFIKQYSSNPEALKELLEECIDANPQCIVEIVRSTGKYIQEDVRNRSLFVMMENHDNITCQIMGRNINLVQSLLNVLDSQPDFIDVLKTTIVTFEGMHKPQQSKPSKPLS